ncbi:MAG: hypothetical protein WBB32_09430 [Flavobacteriales bacterium]|nr:hypothetical protein [Flavobacteriales bacterium]
MVTTSKKFTKRTQEPTAERVLDARSRAVLNAILKEPPGHALEAFLRSQGKRTKKA